MPQKYIFVYQTICEINGKSYIGVHRTDDLEDGYIGCGVYSQKKAKGDLLFHRAVRKYGYSNFKRYILDFFDIYEQALEEEKYLVNETWVKSKSNYNAAIGGEGNTVFWMDDQRKLQWKSNISNKVNEWFSNGGKEKLMAALVNAKKPRNFGSKNGNFGKPSINRRRIIQYSKSLIKLKVFSSVTEAAESVGSIPANVVACCVGRHMTCKDFVLRYEEYSDEEMRELNKNTIRISSEDAKKKRAKSLTASILKNGRKDSIRTKNIHTGEILNGITPLVKLYPPVCFATVKKNLLTKGQYMDWIKI